MSGSVGIRKYDAEAMIKTLLQVNHPTVKQVSLFRMTGNRYRCKVKIQGGRPSVVDVGGTADTLMKDVFMEVAHASTPF